MDILIGLQWGDEGKGKFIDLIGSDYDIIARFNGGANAGHSIYYQGNKVTLKLLPSGIFSSHVKNIIGTGVVVDPIAFKAEIEELAHIMPDQDLVDRILISQKAHLVLPTHRYWDIYMEQSPLYRTIGTTKNGIAPSYSNKILRQNLRVGDIHSDSFNTDVYQILNRQYNELQLLGQEMPAFEELYHDFIQGCASLKQVPIIDTEIFLNKAIRDGKKVLAEGAQATLLDIDHGSYPYVTSSNTIASAACVSLGVSTKLVDKIYGVTKAYCTRVGNGIFPTEITGQAANDLREKGAEFGSNTKRPRRVGWLDLPALKYAIMLNGVTQLVLTKADILNEMADIPVCTHYEIDEQKISLAFPQSAEQEIKPIWKYLKGWNTDFSYIKQANLLPETLGAFISFLEEELQVPINYLSTGPQREELINLAK